MVGMFQKLISLTPVAIASEIDNILRIMPRDFTDNLNALPELKKNVVHEVLLQFTSNQTLSLQNHASSRSPYKAGVSYPYIQEEQLKLLVRYTLLLTLDRLDRGKEMKVVLEPVSSRS
jgi:hypothetical protein